MNLWCYAGIKWLQNSTGYLSVQLSTSSVPKPSIRVRKNLPYWEKKEKKNLEYQNIWHNIRKVCVLLTCWTATPPASQQSSCLQVKTSPRFTQSGFLISRSLFFGFLAFSFSLFSSATVLILWISSELASFVSSARPIAGVWCSAVKRRALLCLKWASWALSENAILPNTRQLTTEMILKLFFFRGAILT